MYRRIALVVVFSLALVLFAACTSQQATPQSGAAAPSGKPVTGGTLRFASYGEALTFDPTFTWQGPEIRLSQSVYDTLVSMDKDTGSLGPGLAESWDVSKDGKTITLKLRKGVKFHDGTDFNAEAVKFNLERSATHPKGAAKPMVGVIQSVDVVDDITARLNLKEPFSPLLNYLSDVWGDMISPTAAKKAGDDEYGRKPVGTGPFQFVEWVRDDHITVKKFDGYWKKDKDGNKLPYLDSILYKPIPDESVRLVNLKSGNLDIMDFPPYKDRATLRTDKNFGYQDRISVGWDYAQFACNKPPFNNKALRQAVNYAIDRDAILKGVFFSEGVPSKSPVSPVSPYNNADTKPWAYDINKAKEKLKEGGKADGFEFTMEVTNRPDQQASVEALQAQLAKAGIKMKIEVMEIGKMLERWSNGKEEYQASYIWWGGTSDLDRFVEQPYKKGGTQASCTTDQLDKLVRDATRSYDAGERKKIYNEAEKLWIDNADMLNLFHLKNAMVYTPKVKNYKVPIQVLFYFDDVWMEK